MTRTNRDQRDRIWIVRMQSGDESSLGELFRAYYSELIVFAQRYVKEPDIAVDVLQDVFAALWLQRAKLEIRGTIASYLYGAVRHRCLSILRHDRIAQQWLTDQTETLGQSPIVVLPDSETNTLTDAIDAAVAQLPPRAQEVFRMSREDGLTHSEIAEALGISVNAVAVTMTRALRALHSALRDWL